MVGSVIIIVIFVIFGFDDFALPPFKSGDGCLFRQLFIGNNQQIPKRGLTAMKPVIVKATLQKEYLTPERCFIYETCGAATTGDKQVSIARARVEPGVTTKAHHLEGVQEIYLITQGKGKVQIGTMEPTEVTVGDTVIIPPLISQKITNTGKTDLIFYCICTPAFIEACYYDEEP